jgi:hypothetical protein
MPVVRKAARWSGRLMVLSSTMCAVHGDNILLVVFPGYVLSAGNTLVLSYDALQKTALLSFTRCVR